MTKDHEGNRTSRDETSVKLVADALEEDRHATSEELYKNRGILKIILKNLGRGKVSFSLLKLSL